MLSQLFTDHPRSLGLTWFEHGTGAFKIGGNLIFAGFAAFIHGIVPGIFTDTAGRTVTETYNYIQKIKAGSGKPEQWSDYDI